MANEAVIISLPRGLNSVRRTVADGTGIEKGTILALTDPNTAAADAGTGVFGGIAATEKVISDGSTTLGCWMSGLFDLAALGPAITVGDQVCSSGANYIREATEAEVQAGKWIGHAEETSSAGTEVIRVRLRGF